MPLERREFARLREKLIEACRRHKHPSRSLSDAVSKLVTDSWADDDPRWATFGWPHWTASKDAALALAEMLGVDRSLGFREKRSDWTDGKTRPRMAGFGDSGDGYGTVCYHGPTGMVGALLKTMKPTGEPE